MSRVKTSSEFAEATDACMKIADFAAGRADKRREFDWKLAFSIWALLVGSIACVRAETFPAFIGVGVFAIHYFWAQAVYLRNKSDHNIAWNAANSVNALLKERYGLDIVPTVHDRIKKSESYGPIPDWGSRVQLAITASLLATFYVVCSNEISCFTLSGLVVRSPG